MKCEEFKTRMVADNPDMVVLESHLEGCEDCSIWLEKELATPPDGLTKAEWQNATSRCMPPISTKDSEAVNEEAIKRPVSTGFFSGIKYGLVFGLSIITGLAIIQLTQEEKVKKAQAKIELESFMEKDSNEIPNFLEKDYSDVTFFEFGDSKIMSFIEPEKITSFLEETQEENSWTEEQSG